MFRLSRQSALLALTSIAALAGCGDKRTVIVDPGTKRPPTGILEVRVVGLPDGANATVNITGPNGFTFALTTTTTIPQLAPGTYTITASKVSTSGDSYDPTPP